MKKRLAAAILAQASVPEWQFQRITRNQAVQQHMVKKGSSKSQAIEKGVANNKAPLGCDGIGATQPHPRELTPDKSMHTIEFCISGFSAQTSVLHSPSLVCFGQEFSLRVYPKGNDSKKDSHVSLFLHDETPLLTIQNIQTQPLD